MGFRQLVSPPLPTGTRRLLLFFAVGMIWSAARLFHGRPVCWGAMFSAPWSGLQPACVAGISSSADARIIIVSIIVATYTFLIAAELWRERRKSLIRRWPALFVPMLHGAIFLFPVALASLGLRSLRPAGSRCLPSRSSSMWSGRRSSCWCLAKDRAVNRYKTAAETDPLTGLLNRRGFFAATSTDDQQQAKTGAGQRAGIRLDHFKSVNDRFGHRWAMPC